MYKLLLIEDDIALAEAIAKGLSNEVVIVRDFQNVMDTFCEVSPNLVLLDIMLPFYSGYHWCAEIRKKSNVPIIFISSASDNMNIVSAISLGADDFIAKPFDSMVLNAKVQAILRRTYELNSNASQIEFFGAKLNLNDSTVTYQDKRLELTKNEFRILLTLLENRKKIVSREALMTALWQSDLYIEENTLTVNVARLRKKLEDGGLSDIIVTKPGSGYIIE